VTDVDTSVRRLLALHWQIPPERIVPEARLAQDLDLDSMDAIELAILLEDAFDISLPERARAHVRSFGDVVQLVKERLGTHAPS
jgi:acyl carrier protein